MQPQSIKIPIEVPGLKELPATLVLLHMANCLCPRRTEGAVLLGRVACLAHGHAGEVTNPDHIGICADHTHHTDR